MRKGKLPIMAPKDAFRRAVESADHLKLKEGLRAIKKGEGRGQITAKDTRQVLGSVDIDGDCKGKAAYPDTNRWDYVIGYDRSGTAMAHFVEVHSAETSEVSLMEKKLAWLRDFLQQQAQEELARLPREYHWVASGRINIPQHTPQYKKLSTSLRKLGLQGPIKTLELA